MAVPRTRSLLTSSVRLRLGLSARALLSLLVLLPVAALTDHLSVREVQAGPSTAGVTPEGSTKKTTTVTSAKKSTKKATTKKSTTKKSTKKSTKKRSKKRSNRAPAGPPYAAAIVIDNESGAVLFSKEPDALRAPASLTKMMTELLALEALVRGDVNLDDRVIVPRDVVGVVGSRIRLIPGEELSFEEVLRAMVIASANDAAVVVAHHVAGSQEAFVRRMNERAKEMGLSATRYVNPHGLDPSDGAGSITSARDQSVLAQVLLNHGSAIELASCVQDTIRGGQVVRNTNRLLQTFAGMDGLKTGYTGRAGYCLASTAKREDLRLVSVLLGAPNSTKRFGESARLLENAFANYRVVRVLEKGEDLGREISVDGGSPSMVRLVAGGDVGVCVPNDSNKPIRFRVEVPESTDAPVPIGSPLGLIEVLVGDSVAVRAPAVAANQSSRGGSMLRYFDFGRSPAEPAPR